MMSRGSKNATSLLPLDNPMIELTGTKSKLEAFLNLLKDYEILELARTGITGLSRGSKDVAFF